MKRLIAVSIAVAGLLGVTAGPAIAREKICIEFYDPEHAESHFVCI